MNLLDLRLKEGPKEFISSILGLIAGVVYGAIARGIFRSGPETNYFLVLTLAFIFVVPMALGVLTVFLGAKHRRSRWYYWLFMPWLPCALLLLGAFLFGIEGTICLIMAAPVFFCMSSFGGLLTGALLRTYGSNPGTYALLVFPLLPFLIAPIEQHFPAPDSIRSADTEITINASPQTVWENIERVRRIEPDEQRFSFFHLMGFPRPVEATLSYEGVGGVRHATFEGGVLFVETIDVWQPQRELRFSIKADPRTIPATTLDEHVTIGGAYFDMLQGDYRIEPINDQQVRLHLSSQHRLSTRFNFYSRLWTEFIMRDIQQNILNIIKRRCEAAQTKQPMAAIP
ncbi:MAG TPA: hypothetical protein VE961_04395 [Pyrinomonadaceae bacterium]|nr:hypothetical protein [Pyrinomonadaceae bacterium]